MKRYIATLLHCYIVKKKKRQCNNLTIEQFNNFSPRRGFTLIELLVVVAVITVVLAVVFPNFMGARQRARDTQRKSDLSQIQKALELYKLDQSPAAYPTSGAFLEACPTITCWSSSPDCGGNIYMRKVPCDPGSSGVQAYIYATPDPPDPLKYTLSACLENLVDLDRDPTPAEACSLTGTSYTIHEP